MDLPGGQTQGDGTGFRIDERVDFAGEPPTGTSHATIVKSPFFPVLHEIPGKGADNGAL